MRPSFFIVGAPKAGTSSMAHYLRQHPGLFLPDRKDVPFFGGDLDYRRQRPSPAEYLAQFDAAGEDALAGDACTSYLQSRRAAAEIAEFEPAARIVIMLREPVAAMRSMHGHLCYLRSEDIESFEGALAAERERAAGARLPAGVRLVGDLQYRDVFTYAPKVRRFLEQFDRDQVLVLLFDDLREDPLGTAREVYEFLGVDPTFVPHLEVVNARKSTRVRWLHSLAMNPPERPLRLFNRLTPRSLHGRLIPFLTRLNTHSTSAPEFDPELRSALELEAAPDLAELAELIERDLSAWMPAAGPTPQEQVEVFRQPLPHGLR
jgi:Sulfotransferase domain